jgi:protoporphyrinogen oxidase
MRVARTDLPLRRLDGGARTAILGAGPGGLTAAYVLARAQRPAVVFEADDTVGGIARTVEYDGYRFDMGGHRFFTKLQPVQQLWVEMLGTELLTRPRLSRIYYDGTYFAYPLKLQDVVRRLGVVESARCGLSYLGTRRHSKPPETFEEWVTERFGRRLYDAFFRSYTEKVWGIPGSEIRSEWAAQRIKNFSLRAAVLDLLNLRRGHVTTLIEEFVYPRLGPGQMWEAFQEYVEAAGIPVLLNHRCMAIHHRDGRVQSIVVRTDGEEYEEPVDAVLSTIPLNELVLSLDPPAPDDVVAAAKRLRYRALCVVALITTESEPFPDNWIYLHDPGVRAGRVQNFGAWSESMVRPGTSCLGVEYFCFEEDDIWSMPQAEAIELAKTELARIGLIDPAQVVDGVKVCVPNAYPMYDSAYREAVDVIRAYLEEFENLKTFGRNGLHRYNNQDHSMWTAMLATLNLLRGTRYDVWSVNVEADYLEEGEAPDAVVTTDPLTLAEELAIRASNGSIDVEAPRAVARSPR